jgi:O-antigen/teichoic acid export membrane protein
MFSNSLHDFTQSVCNGLDRVDVARNLLLVQRGISFVVIILFIWFSKNLVHVMMGLAVAGVLGGSISFLLFLKTMKSKISWKINKKEAWRIFRKSFPIGIGGVFGIFYMRWGHILCAWELTPKNLGDYSAAFRIFEFSFIIPAAIMNIGVPHLSESLKIGFPEFQRRYKKLLLLILPIGFLWGAFLILGAKPIVYLLFGQKYFEAVGPLRWLGAAGALVFINYAITHVLIIINRQTRNAVHEFIVFVMIFIFSIAFIPSYGITGAAVSIVLGELILMVLTLYFFWSGRHHIPKDYVQAVETTPAPPTF